jgi:hypothetical protein
MPTLTSSATFTIGAGSPSIETLDIAILPPANSSLGRGRLIHPSLGILDYASPPDVWQGIDTDILTPPVWASTKTLSGAAHTLWRGTLRDGIAIERWTGESGVSMSLPFLRTLIAIWQSPVDPAAGAVQWWPSYTTALGFEVILTDLTVGGQGITLDYLTRQGWVAGAVVLTLRITGRVI